MGLPKKGEEGEESKSCPTFRTEFLGIKSVEGMAC